MKKIIALSASILCALLTVGCGGMTSTDSLQDSSSNSSSAEPQIVEETIYDFEGNNPLKGGGWYTQKYTSIQLMEEIVDVDGNAMLKITPKLNSWAGVIANPFIGLGSAVTQFKITVSSEKQIDGLRFEMEYDLYKWTEAKLDIQIGTHEYVLEFEQPVQFLFGFSVKANPSEYDCLYLDDLRTVKYQ
jgi:hypothetical protein